MGISAQVSVSVSGIEMPDVLVTFGIDFPRQRKRLLREGYGQSIELPAVIDIVAAIEAGTITAAEVRELLLRLAGQVYDGWDLREHEQHDDLLAWCVRDGGCPDCEKYGDRFDPHLDALAERWRRYNTPDEYPFTVGRSAGLHETTCPVVRRTMPTEWSRPVAEEYVQERRLFCHQQNLRYGGTKADFEFEMAATTADSGWTVMTIEETRVWEARHTGPKGGRKYRRCQRCAPTP
ncbi:hypothetical protein [Kitasatospora sp. NPDC056531]|uniref:hypothetical protein n=1 Tax=Kitasatospora sp. NPDC056531 TaxID=3345856 RepID=UPI00369DC057